MNTRIDVATSAVDRDLGRTALRRLARTFDPMITRLAGARVGILILFHGFVFAACYVLATLVRFDFTIPSHTYEQLFRSSLPIVVCTELLLGFFFGFYRGWWRYVGMAEVVRTASGMFIAHALLLAAWYFMPPLAGISRGVLLINFAFTVLTLFGARVLVRMTRDRLREDIQPDQLERVVIVGAGDAGEALARELEHRPTLGKKVVAFVDDLPAKWDSQIRGIKVHGPISRISDIANKVQADEALIAIPTASGARMREIIHCLSDAGLAFKTMPGIDQFVTGKLHVTQLRPVNVEDLLRRDKIDLPGDPVRRLFRGKRVMITGAGGTIGSELASQVLGFEPKAVSLVERSEFALYQVRRRLERERGSLDGVHSHLVGIREYETMNALLGSFEPHIVLHAAAHKHVSLGEENSAEYVLNNTLATRKLAEMCEQHGVRRFVFISTDKAINPTSVMGATKRAAEILLLDLAERSKMRLVAVRFGNVIGSSGSVVPRFLEQIANGGPITVTHPDVTRYFLRTSEAILLVLQAAALGETGRVLMLDMGEPVRIVDLARDMIRLSNHTEDEIPIVFTGLKPGEKLHEEVRMQRENIEPTAHPQIVITEGIQPHPAIVAQWMKRVELACSSNDLVVLLLKDLIPEYTLPEHHARLFAEHETAFRVGAGEVKRGPTRNSAAPELDHKLTH